MMGKIESNNIQHLDVEAMREGNQLNMLQREVLTARVAEIDIVDALKDIGDLKAPVLDGFGEKKFKAI